ncbi:MAG TPA: V-type ATPase 116kDa subunit family protein [Anaerolineae bacterium]|nr:V-type ATPase 116kDa subunit family protein [Anaerolineae bacterium]HQI86097.1 V-type ATPase 116kDa subunit family protein [Anaerolineae bacterium]
MFKPQAMSKVELVIPDQEVVRTTEALAASGIFHQIPTAQTTIGMPSRGSNEWQTWTTDLVAVERRILFVMEELKIDEGAPPATPPHIIEPRVAERDIERLEHEAETPVRELEAARRRLTQLQKYVGQLAPIADLDIDLGTLRDLRYTFVMLGSIPAANIERLESSLEHVPFVLITLRHEGHLATVVLFGLQQDATVLNRAARSAYLNTLMPPEDYRGTPAQAIAALQAGIERTRQRISEYEMEIAHLQETRIRHLRHLLWRVRASHTLANTITGYDHLQHTYLVTGWVPRASLAWLEQVIAKVSDKVVIETLEPRQEDIGHIPASLKNPPFFSGFQGLVTTYGQPNYDELDPTPMMALTFPLVFGLMFGDVGHGLLLLLVGLLLAGRKIKALQGAAGFGVVVALCGAAAMVFGALYGSIFGFEDVFRAVWFRPLEKITDILLFAIIVGVLLISAGIIYNMVNAALNRRWGSMLFNRNGLAGLIFYWSLLGLGARVFGAAIPISGAILAIIGVLSGVGLTFAELFAHLVEGHRPLIEGDAGTYLALAFFELFETLISLFSNTLSYVRMGAFAVAHGALSLVVFIIAGVIGARGSVGYWIVVILGNLFVIGFEGMIVGIQTLRLEYYELFSKFFSGGGMPYRPLSLIPQAGKLNVPENAGG